MKRLIGFAAALTALALFAGCASSSVKGSGVKGKAGKMVSSKIEIVDYQGASFGKEIPEWVMLVAEGQYSTNVLSKAMSDLKNKKVFVTLAQGDNLEFVKQWTDLVDVEVQVGDTMQRVVGKAVSASEVAGGKEVGKDAQPTELERSLSMYKEAVSAVEVNGLEKVASYWIEKIVTDKNKNKIESFEYYAVWAMDKDRYDRQIDAAMDSVQDNTSEGEKLKEILRTKLADVMISSNSAAVEEIAYDL